MANDSNLSRPTKNNETAPIKMHHRLALGEKGVNGQSNPYGAAKVSTVKKVANQPKTY